MKHQSLALAVLMAWCMFALVPVIECQWYGGLKPGDNRECTYSCGDPHVWSHKSNAVTHIDEACLDDQVWIPLFSSPDISIKAFTVMTPGAMGSLQTNVQASFHNGKLTESYSASPCSLPSTFSSGSSIVYDSTGAKWLEITSYSPNSVTIQDYHTQSTILITLNTNGDSCYFDVFFCTTPKLLASGKGYLVNGCSPKTVNNPIAIKDIDICKNVRGANNPILNEKIARRICNMDAPLLKDSIVEALNNNIELLDRMTEVDRATFADAKA